jgi:hypothetical protein
MSRSSKRARARGTNLAAFLPFEAAMFRMFSIAARFALATRFAVALLIFVAPAQAAAQSLPRVASLDWMAGTWTQETPAGRTVTESWVGPGHGLMVAANLATFPNGRKSYEFLRIADTADGVSYFASPGGKPPVEFKLRESGDRRVVFENPAHDFPQRILYWRDGEVLVARIEGTVKGQARSEEWRFGRRH